MLDLHCHILPGVDDGARTLDESLAMLAAAKRVGITRIVCTPHCRSPYFDYDAMWSAFELLQQHAGGFPLSMGFEVNYTKLMELGFEWIDHLAFDQTNEFLLELNTRCTPANFVDYERAIFAIQGRGYKVIIAHPERYLAVQNDMSMAQRLIDMGCKLQCSADFITGGRLGEEKKPAKKMFKAGMYTYLCSDAHNVQHYEVFAQAYSKYASLLN